MKSERRRSPDTISAPASAAAAEGRAACTEELEALLARSSLPRNRLLDLLARGDLETDHLARLAADPRATRLPAARRALVLHAATPLPVARRLVEHLGWRDLADVAAAPHTRPELRRRAERLLEARLPGLTLGERTALARRACGAPLTALSAVREEPVLCALLSNPRLREVGVVALAAAATTPEGALRAIAGHPRWGGIAGVRRALVTNPRTPVPVALAAVVRMPIDDLRRVVPDVKVPRIVRVGAERRLRSLLEEPDVRRKPNRTGGSEPR